MLARVLADLVLMLHLAFIAWVLLGGLVALRSPRWVWAHVPAVVWAVWIEFSGGICPLTPLENRLRRLSGEAGYEGSFVEHYLVALIYPHDLTRELQFVLGAVVLVVNLAVYGWLWRRRCRANSVSIGSGPRTGSGQAKQRDR